MPASQLSGAESSRASSVSDDLVERFCVQAGSSDQRAVDLRLTHQAGDVVRFDGAPVENTHAAGAGSTEMPGYFAADDGVSFVCLLRRCHAARADGPDRLIGDDHLAAGGPLDAVERDRNLPAENCFRQAGLTLVESFADAHYGNEVMFERRLQLEVDHVVRLVGVDAALRVAE